MIPLAVLLLSAVTPVSPGESIQAALDASAPGDTVLLLPGTHTGSGEHLVSISGLHDGVTLLGDVDDPSLVVVDGSSLSGSIVDVDGLNQGPVGAGTVVAGMTFTGAQLTDASLGGAMHSLYASQTVVACVFSGNSADCGGGAYVWRGSPSFVSCQFTDNQCVTSGAGLYAYSCDSTLRILSCTFTGNYTTDDGGGIFLYHSSPLIRNALVVDNFAWDNGGGIYCYGQSDPDIGFCTLVGNEVSYQGSAIYFRQGSSPSVHDNIVTGNVNPALWMDGGGAPVFWNNCVWGNSGGDYGNLPDPTGTAGNISEDPLLTAGYHLSNQLCGQPVTSPCVDAGSADAGVYGLDIYWTRTDSVPDQATVDMGYHYGPLPGMTGVEGSPLPPPALQLYLYPNPCPGVLYAGPSAADGSTLAVFGIDGRLVYSGVLPGGDPVPVDLYGLDPGVYLVLVSTPDGSRSGLVTLLTR
jgi:hypothetical protein